MRQKALGTIFLMAMTFGVALPASAVPVTLGSPTATWCQLNNGSYPISATIDGSTAPSNGWAIDNREGSSQTAVFKTAMDITNSAGTNLTFTLDMLDTDSVQHELGRFRIAATTSARTLYGQGADPCLDASPGGTATWTVLTPQSVTSANGQTLTVQGDGSVLASGALPSTDVVTFRVTTSLQGITGFRLEAIADSSLPHSGPGRQPFNGNFVLTEFIVDQTAVLVPVPTPALESWSMALLSLLLGGAGMIWLRRRRT